MGVSPQRRAVRVAPMGPAGVRGRPGGSARRGDLPPGEPRASGQGGRAPGRSCPSGHARRDGLPHDDGERARRPRVGGGRDRGGGGDARPADVPADAAGRGGSGPWRAPAGNHRDRPGPHAHADAPRARGGRQVRRVLRGRVLDARARGSGDALEHVSRVRCDLRVLAGGRGDPALPGADRPRRPRGPRRALHERAGAVPSRRRPRAGVHRDPRARPRRDRAVGRRPQAAARPGPALTRVGFVRRGVPRPARARPRRDRRRPPPRGGRESGGRGRSRRDRGAGDRGARPAQPRRCPSRIRGDRRDHELHEHVEPRGDARRRPAGEEGRRGGPGDQAVGQDLPRPGIARGDRVPRCRRSHAVPGQARVLARRFRVHDVHRELRAAAGRGRGRRDGERPGRGRRPVGEPQLRGADPSARPSELPGVAAARGRLRPRRSRRGRPLEPAARRHGGRDRGVPARPVAVVRRGASGDRGVRLARAVRTRIRQDLRRGRALARAAHARGSRVRVGSELDLRAGATLLQRPRTRRPRSRSTSSVRAASSRLGTRSRPTTSRRREPSRWTHRPVAT